MVVNDLIQNCFQQVSLVGDGQVTNGTQAKAGLNDLNRAVSELNSQEYILSSFKTYDVDHLNERTKLTIGVGDGFDLSAETPLKIKSVSVKRGNVYEELTPTNITFLNSRTKMGTPDFFCYSTEYSAEHSQHVTTMFFDGDTEHYQIVALTKIPEYKLNDEIQLEPIYLSLLEAALCVKLCIRYKLDYLQMYRDELTRIKNDIKRVNNSNRPVMTNMSDCTASYYDCLTGRGF